MNHVDLAASVIIKILKHFQKQFLNRDKPYWKKLVCYILWENCDVQNWSNIKYGGQAICGNCAALIDDMPTFKTCEAYCASQDGLDCVGAYEEFENSCTIESTHTCDYDFSDTSDAICVCAMPKRK